MNTPNPTATEETEEINLRELLGTLLRYWKSIALFTLVGATVGLYLAYVTPPVYSTNALIQVESKNKPSISDMDSVIMYAMSRSQSPAELEIVRSRSIIQGAVESLNLDIVAKPLYFGKFGTAYARRHGDSTLQAPFLIGLGDYAWGGERIQVNRFDVPETLLNKTFYLEAGEGKNFRLLTANKQSLAQGLVEKPLLIERPGGNIELYISELYARPGTLFILKKRPSLNVITALQNGINATEQGLRSGIITLTLNGSDPQRIRDQLNAVANTYLRDNVEKQSEEATKVLAFLGTQLPLLKESVDSTESELRNYQAQKGTVDLSLEAGNLLDKLTALQQQQSELKLQLAELKQKFTDNHPLVQSLSRKLAQANQQLSHTEKELKKLPATESAFLKLKRDTLVANELYVQLLNRYQELKIVKAGISGFVRIIDPAYLPQRPIGPKRLLLLLGPLLAALIAGLLLAIARHALSHKIENPEIIEKKIGLPTYAAIPYSQKQNALERMRRNRENRSKLSGAQVLARLLPQDLAVESIRSLRTNLQFAMLESDNNIVTITGATPDLGKSFVSENLAYLLAETQQNVLLIDADMRLGHLDHNLVANRKPGLSDYISGHNEFDTIVQTIGPNGLNFIACGTRPPNPAELLVSDRFKQLLDKASHDFDMVIVDTPPILTMTDGILAAQASGVCLLVARAGATTIHELELATKRLRQNNVKLKGAILNGMTVGALGYGYSAYKYTNKYHPNKQGKLASIKSLFKLQ